MNRIRIDFRRNIILVAIAVASLGVLTVGAVLADRDDDAYNECYDNCVEYIEEEYGDVTKRDRRRCRAICREIFK